MISEAVAEPASDLGQADSAPVCRNPGSVLRLFVSVPVTCLRAPKAREYLETLPCPAPSTVYGMLLSLVGEEDMKAHLGCEIAVGVVGRPQLSTVLRTVWRVKSMKHGPGIDQNRRPDFQELLTGLVLVVALRDRKERPSSSLRERVQQAFASPESVRRYGGLSLGESTYLVDEIRPWREGDPNRARFIAADPSGDLTLPIWADHVGSSATVFGQYRLVDASVDEIEGSDEFWTEIRC